jgi:hypothetical protein
MCILICNISKISLESFLFCFKFWAYAPNAQWHNFIFVFFCITALLFSKYKGSREPLCHGLSKYTMHYIYFYIYSWLQYYYPNKLKTLTWILLLCFTNVHCFGYLQSLQDLPLTSTVFSYNIIFETNLNIWFKCPFWRKKY